MMVRLMVYSNEFEIEGLIASASGTPGESNQAVTKPRLIHEVVDAYEQVRDNLALHADGYPTADHLRARIKSGNPQRGLDAIGQRHDTDGSRWIISVVDRGDPRPVNITIWGGQTDLAQALWRVRSDRGVDGLNKFIERIQISSNGRYFEYADGTPLLLLADTLWSGNTARCGLGEKNDGPFFQYLADRRAKGFNAVLIKYLNGFDDGPANPTGERNEGGYAFLQRDVKRLNPKYFPALDRRMDAIWSHGLVAAIPAAWWGKTNKSVFDIEWAKRVSTYCAVRYGAYNSLWCLSGEYQYAFKDCGWTEESFNDLGRTVQAHNPYGHPLSIHPSARLDWPPPHNCQSSRPFHESGWLDHHWLQTGQSIDRMHNIVTRATENRALSPRRPVFCAEGYYDVADDADQAYYARRQAWVAVLSGCAGYGYGAYGIWQFFDPADPKGETGKKDRRVVPWAQALQFEGSTIIRSLRSLLSRHPWWQLEPHRDWLLVDGQPSPLPTATDLTPPHCATAAGQLYLVYIPRGNASRTLKLTKLQDEDFQGHWYNPRAGESTPLAEAPTGVTEWPIPQRPSPVDEDWVLCLEKRQ